MMVAVAAATDATEQEVEVVGTLSSRSSAISNFSRQFSGFSFAAIPVNLYSLPIFLVLFNNSTFQKFSIFPLFTSNSGGSFFFFGVDVAFGGSSLMILCAAA